MRYGVAAIIVLVTLVLVTGNLRADCERKGRIIVAMAPLGIACVKEVK